MNRSGTKWLTNLLCGHPDVAGLQAPAHTGAIETNLFGNMETLFGDLRPVENYVAFVEAWSQTDLFKASGCAKEIFYREPRPRTYFHAFQQLMEDFAGRRGARFWLQKTSPLAVRPALKFFRECKVVCVHRDVGAVVRSTIQLARTTSGSDSLLRAAFQYAYQEKLLTAVEREPGALAVRYEDLRKDTASVLAEICEYVGLDPRPGLETQTFEQNTSFRAVSRDEVLSDGQLALVRALVAAFRKIPLNALDRSWQLLRNREPYLVPGTYREIEDRYGLKPGA